MTKESTLCYIEKDGKYLMLHRTVKENDVNKDKWIGVGGHFEHGESPEECLLREVKEETGYTLTSWKYRGIVTFVYGADTVEYMSLYTADGFEGEPIACDEGDLEWVEKERLYDLELWEGDKIFFRLLDVLKRFKGVIVFCDLLAADHSANPAYFRKMRNAVSDQFSSFLCDRTEIASGANTIRTDIDK